jgi:hypothetical protein
MRNKNKNQYMIVQLEQLVHKICHFRQISLYHFRFGPKKYTQHQFVALLILFARSGKSSRKFVESLYESRWPEWLKLKDIPCKSSLHNHFSRIGLTLVRFMNKFALQERRANRLAVDSTGIDMNHASKHYEKRIGRDYRKYLKLSILGQVEKPYLIEDFACEPSHISDVRQAKPLISRMGKNNIVFADKAYDCNWLMELAEQKGSELYCPIRNSSRNRPKGRLRKKLFDNFNKKFYNKGRNPIELIMFLLKHQGLVIRSKKVCNQIKEVAWKILAYNIERIARALQLLLRLIRLWTAPIQEKLYKPPNSPSIYCPLPRKAQDGLGMCC